VLDQARGMNTPELIRRSSAPRSASESPTVGEMLAETVPLAGVIAGFGPPVVFLAGPWLLFVLALAGPFALVFTFVVLLVAAALLVVLAGTILATPYLLVRHLRRHRTGHLSVSSPAVQLVTAQSQRARA
jgi:hypothetical protein